MGLCNSSDKLNSDTEPIKNGDKLSENWPGSSTKKGKPANLKVGDGNSRNHDPNAANATPKDQSSGTIQPTNKSGNTTSGVGAPVKMYIPWEQPVLGSTGPPKGFPGKSKKRKNADLHKAKKSKDLVFIPGSGNEKMLMAGENSRPSSVASVGKVQLKPLKDIRNEAKADEETSDAIQQAKKIAQERRDLARGVNRMLTAGGILDNEIKRLIRQYAAIGKNEEEQDTAIYISARDSQHMTEELRAQVKVRPSQNRTVISCPVKQ